jgi:hypothetical protein
MKTINTVVLIFWISYSFAQNVSDTLFRKSDVIKLEVSSNIFFTNAFILSWEHVRKPKQSWAIQAGYLQITPFFTRLDSIIESPSEAKSSGFKIGGEYRFYLGNENKYAAPRGVYIGPYISYLQFDNERNLRIEQQGKLTESKLDMNFGILNLGFQLGYQFILKDRWSLDFIIAGPSIANYRIKSTLEGDLEIDIDNINNDILNGLINSFPLLGQLIRDGEVSEKGRANSWNMGYRYHFHVGYRFAGKERKN